MAFLSDTFTEGSYPVDLTSHTPETGGTWILHTGGTSLQVVTPGEVTRAGGVSATCYNDAAPASNEYDVECDILVGSSESVGVLGRLLSSALTGYQFRWQGALGRWELVRWTAGSETVLGSYTTSLVSGDTVKGEIRTAAKKLYVNGTERISSADDTHTGAGYCGVRCLRNDHRLDGLVATDVSAGGISIPVATHHYRRFGQ